MVRVQDKGSEGLDQVTPWTMFLKVMNHEGYASFDGIIVETKELDDKTLNGRLYLNKVEMEVLIIKMQEMMRWVLEK